MRRFGWVAACALLGACGGGGGGVASAGSSAAGGDATGGTPTPSPTPTPTPTPTPNTTLDALTQSQTFTADAANGGVGFQLPGGVVTRSASAAGTIQVSYNAASRSYTVQTQGRTATFGPGDLTATDGGQQRYAQASGNQRDYLTLVTTPYYSATRVPNHYVGLGYWQRNLIGADAQDTSFDTFTYGIETAAAAVPRSGGATWTTDVFGLLTTPGARPRTVQGQGVFAADFAAGAFSTTAYLDETDFLNGGGLAGALTLQGGGALGSGNGFSGSFSYDGSIRVNGTIAGKFYGPGAEEVGAAFSATNATGGALTGALTGQRAATGTNLSLLNTVATQRLVAPVVGLEIAARPGVPGFFQVSPSSTTGFITVRPGGPPDVDTGSSNNPFAQLTAADQVAPARANVTSYDKTINGTPVHIDLYKPGPANTEVALTYLSYGDWRASFSEPYYAGGTLTRDRQLFFLYGYPTPIDLLTNRTGTARYDGVVAAAGASMDGHSYAIAGTSRFDVDFGAQRYTGALSMIGQEGNAARDFGTFTFGSTLSRGLLMQASFDGTTFPGGNTITPVFYGPAGEEIGAQFRLRIGPYESPAGVDITGVAVARRR